MQIIDHGGARIAALHDKKTGSWQYVVSDPVSRKCAIIDPVWDFDEKAAATSTRNADAILDYVKAEGLTVEWLLDTHPHADHFSAAPYLNEKLEAPTAIGEKVIGVQRLWKDIYGLDDEFPTDGRQWDRLFQAGDTFAVGDLTGRVIFSPGHTLASITYVIGGNAFVHDTLMMPYAGTSRADFPGGDSKALYRSIQDILALPAPPPVVYVTGAQDGRIAVAALRAGAADYVIKDVSEDFTALLRSALDATRSGGRVLYCTCSFAPEENELVVAHTLKRLAGVVELEPIASEDLLLEAVDHQGGDLEAHGLVDLSQDMSRHDAIRLKLLIVKHLHYTNSAVARRVLDDWDNQLTKFVKVMPVDYRRALQEMQSSQSRPPQTSQPSRRILEHG
jgi:glyoxylase-like metal-dependent hydrolase (beta-lactamase superfamily II)